MNLFNLGPMTGVLAGGGGGTLGILSGATGLLDLGGGSAGLPLNLGSSLDIPALINKITGGKGINLAVLGKLLQILCDKDGIITTILDLLRDVICPLLGGTVLSVDTKTGTLKLFPNPGAYARCQRLWQNCKDPCDVEECRNMFIVIANVVAKGNSVLQALLMACFKCLNYCDERPGSGGSNPPWGNHGNHNPPVCYEPQPHNPPPHVNPGHSGSPGNHNNNPPPHNVPNHNPPRPPSRGPGQSGQHGPPPSQHNQHGGYNHPPSYGRKIEA